MRHEIVDALLARPDASPEALLAVVLDGDAAFSAGPMSGFVFAAHMAAAALPTCSPGFPLAVRGLARSLATLHDAACAALGLPTDGGESGCHVRRDAWLPLAWLLVRNLSEIALVGILSCDCACDCGVGVDERLVRALQVAAVSPSDADCEQDAGCCLAAAGERTVRLTLEVVESGRVSAAVAVSEIGAGPLRDVACPASRRKLRRAVAAALAAADLRAAWAAVAPDSPFADHAPLSQLGRPLLQQATAAVAALSPSDASAVWYCVAGALDARAAAEVLTLARDPPAVSRTPPHPPRRKPYHSANAYDGIALAATTAIEDVWAPGRNAGVLLSTVIDAVALQCPEDAALPAVPMGVAGVVSAPFWAPLAHDGALPPGMHVLLGFRSDREFTGTLLAANCARLTVPVRAGPGVSWVFPGRLPLPIPDPLAHVVLHGAPPGAAVEAVGLRLSRNANATAFLEDSAVPGHVEMRRPFMQWTQPGGGATVRPWVRPNHPPIALWKPVAAPI